MIRTHGHPDYESDVLLRTQFTAVTLLEQVLFLVALLSWSCGARSMVEGNNSERVKKPVSTPVVHIANRPQSYCVIATG